MQIMQYCSVQGRLLMNMNNLVYLDHGPHAAALQSVDGHAGHGDALAEQRRDDLPHVTLLDAGVQVCNLIIDVHEKA